MRYPSTSTSASVVLGWWRPKQVAVLDGVELQWLLGADIDLHGLVTIHVDQAITRWTTRPGT